MPAFYLKKIDAVFVHIMKTGGLSIRSTRLKGMFTGEGVEETDDRDWPDHWPATRTFTFIRHPLSRFMSGYTFCQRRKRGVSVAEALWIAGDPDIQPQSRRPGWKQFYKTHLMPQTHPWYQMDKAVMVCRQEHYTAALRSTCRRLGCPVPSIRHVNRSGAPKWPGNLSEEEQRMVRDFYHDDFIALGYPEHI